MENLALLIAELCKLPSETPWLEFKHDNYTPEMIGQDICALANSATLYDRDRAYMVWGIHDTIHEVVGTKHNLQNLKKATKNWKIGCAFWNRKTVNSNIKWFRWIK